MRTGSLGVRASALRMVDLGREWVLVGTSTTPAPRLLEGPGARPRHRGEPARDVQPHAALRRHARADRGSERERCPAPSPRGPSRRLAGLGAALLLGSLPASAQTRQAVLGGAFHGIAFGDSIEDVTARIGEQCLELRTVELETPRLPLAREREAHLIASEFQTDDGASLAKVAFSFADGELTLVEAHGGALPALGPRAGGSPMSFLGYEVFPEARLVVEVARDTAWVLSQEALEANLFLDSNPALCSVEAVPPVTPSARKPDFLVFGTSLEECLAALEHSGARLQREEIAEPWLETRPAQQTQLNCFGPAYAGFPRKIEAVFGDGRLQLAWILTAAGEEARLRAALIEAYGPPMFVSADWEAFEGWQVALRKDRPEVLMLAPELVPFYRARYGADAPLREGQAVDAAQDAAPRARAALLIRDVTLISPERPTPLEHADVLVREGRIAAIGPELVSGEGTEIIDGRGRFLIPGLIDSHVHVGHPILLDDETIEARPELLRAYQQQVPRSFLHAGFTTVIDLDLRPETSAWFLAAPVHPHLHHAGRGVRIAGGYGPALFPPARAYQIFPSLVFEPEQAERWPAGLDREQYSPARAVQRVKDAGAICLKTYVEPGFGGVFDWPIPSLSTLVALHEQAESNGLPFVVHATDTEGWRRALAAGADVLVHGLWHWPGDRRDPEPSAEALAVIAEAARRGVAVQPTLRVLFGERETFTWERLEDPRVAEVLPSALIEWARGAQGHRSQRELHALGERLEQATSVPADELLDAMNRRALRSLQCLLASGVRLILGSDTPAAEGPGNPPGLNGFLELELWAKAGVPLAQILAAATLDNARAFGLEHELGSIELGKRADLLLLRANPLTDVQAYDAIEGVMLDGEWIQRTSLAAPRTPGPTGR